MATVTRTYLVDDLDESEEDVDNVLFALDGTNYEIDLSAANAGRLREKLARFIDAASPVKVSKSAPAKRGPKGKAAPVPSNVSRSKRSASGPRLQGMRCPVVAGSRGRSRRRSTRPTD